MVDERHARRHDAAGIRRFEHPVNRPLGVPQSCRSRPDRGRSPTTRSAAAIASHMTPSAAIPPATPTKFGSVSSTMPLTFGVTATGRSHSVTHRRIRAAFAGSMLRPITTSGRFAPFNASSEGVCLLACRGARTLNLRTLNLRTRTPNPEPRTLNPRRAHRGRQRLPSGKREVRRAVRPLHALRQRARHDLEHVAAGDLVHVPRHRPIGVVKRQQLVGVAGGKPVRDLRRDREQRLLIQIRAAQRQHQVRRSRPQRRQHHARLAAQLAVHRRRDAGVRFVAHQHEVDAGASKLVDQDEHFAARKSEHAFDPGIGKNFGGRSCGRRHCRIY